MKFWMTLFEKLIVPLMGRKYINLYQKGRVVAGHVVTVNFVTRMPWAHAFVVGTSIYVSISQSRWDGDKELQGHEEHHVVQWVEKGFWLPFLYFASAIIAPFQLKHPTSGNYFEEQAKKEGKKHADHK